MSTIAPEVQGPRRFRAVNEWIHELEGKRPVGEYDFCCECEDETCTGVLRLTEQEYRAVRTEESWFTVLPGHERPADDVISRADRFVVISRPRDGEPAQTRVGDRIGAHDRTYKGLGLYRRLLLEARPYWLHVAGLLALSLLSSAFALLTPVPLAIVADSVVGNPLPGFVPADSETGVLLFAAGLLLVIALVKQLQEFGRLWLSTYAGENLLLQFRSRLFRHAERVSLGYHDSRGSADSTYRIQYDATAVSTIAVTGLIPIFTAIVTVAGMIYVTARIDWQLALVSLAVAPALFLAMRVYRKRLRAQWHDAKKLESSALSVVQESLEALRVVKAFGREDDQRDRFADRSAASVRAKVGVSAVEGRFGIVVGAAIGLGMATVLFLGTRRVLAGAITLGELTLVMGYLQQLYDPLKTASKKVGSLQSALASAERSYSLLDEEPDFVDPPDALPLERSPGSVVFRNVSFAYERDQHVLDDISFEITPGTRLGISGATGAGKTTLMSLLTRFYDPSAGQILLDGVDLRRYRLADLRNQFAIVLQEPVLFSTSIGENIAYARPGADDADVVAAAKAASADDFIRALPEGYATPVGERGVRLSGGERQRIALARAFLKDAPILILDEPTSSVDARTEAEILEAMERLMTGRTAFVIAHRPSTLEICDMRLELEHGRVANSPASDRAAVAPAPPAEVRRLYRNRITSDFVNPAQAWRAVTRERVRPDRVEVVRMKRKSQIYRLEGIGRGGAPVIAKRGLCEPLLVERTIYESVLPRLAMPALQYYGFLREDDGNFAWLFIEDAGDERCFLQQQPALAARWLGELHGGAAGLGVASSLPERGPAHYLRHLRAARTRILANLDNSALGADDRRALRALVSMFGRIETCWSRVEAICDELPSTLVHGDFTDRNLRLRRDNGTPTILAVDWECAGWGVPGADIHLLASAARREDLLSYRSAISEHGRALDEDELRLLSLVGSGFWLLAAVDWASTYLQHPWPQKGMATMREYEQPLRVSVAAVENAA